MRTLPLALLGVAALVVAGFAVAQTVSQSDTTTQDSSSSGSDAPAPNAGQLPPAGHGFGGHAGKCPHMGNETAPADAPAAAQ